MKAAALVVAALLLQSAAAGPPVAEPKYLRYLRALKVAQTQGQGMGQACAVLDAQVFPHAAPSLIDLRVFSSPAAGATFSAAGAPFSAAGAGAPASAAQDAGGAAAPHEVPYAITLSESVSEETASARLLNLGIGEGVAHAITFDLEMPERPYSTVTLDLDPALHDFLATADVTATDALGGHGHSVTFGSFTIFDLSAQHLSRSTMLPLPESTFRYLHITLAMADAPGRTESAAEQIRAVHRPGR